jgi:siroheme synthase-like protein
MPSQPPYYPIFLDLRGRRVVVIGGGAVAAEKVVGLLEAGARVVVVAPRTRPLPEAVEVHRRPWAPSDLARADLVIAATDDTAVNQAVAAEARERGIWVNVVDVPELCDFIAPALLRRGPLRIAVSTGGASPLLARRVKERIAAHIDKDWGMLAELLGELRRDWHPRLQAAGLDQSRRKAVWEAVMKLPLLAELRTRGLESARQMAADTLKNAECGMQNAECGIKNAEK